MFPFQTGEMHLHAWAWLRFCVKDGSPQACLGSRGLTGGVSSPDASLVMELSTAPSLDCAQSGAMRVHMELDL